MLPSENINKIILEYNEILVRDLGFSDWKIWEPMISKIIDILGVSSLCEMSLGKAHKYPGKEIVKSLINSWISKKGKYWKNLVGIEKSTKITPYNDYVEYKIKIKTKKELLEELSGPEVYLDYQILQNIFESQDYKTLIKLNGTKIELKQ